MELFIKIKLKLLTNLMVFKEMIGECVQMGMEGLVVAHKRHLEDVLMSPLLNMVLSVLYYII
jgi:hypothetical protein